MQRKAQPPDIKAFTAKDLRDPEYIALAERVMTRVVGFGPRDPESAPAPMVLRVLEEWRDGDRVQYDLLSLRYALAPGVYAAAIREAARRTKIMRGEKAA